jgi:hypothetical protein
MISLAYIILIVAIGILAAMPIAAYRSIKNPKKDE